MGALSRELFERGDPYGTAALDLVQQAANGQLPPMPQLGKDQSLLLLTRFADRKVMGKYVADIGETLGCSYQFTMAETWEDLITHTAVGYVDSGLAQVLQQHLDTGVADPLDPSVQQHRVHYTLMGLIGTHPAFEDLRAYVVSRAAFERLETLDETHLQLGLAMADVRGRHAESFMHAQILAWTIGRSLGVLSVIGELTD